MLLSHDAFAKSLGYDFQPSNGEKYRTCLRNINTPKFQITITGIRLPHLRRMRTFAATFKIPPKESGDFRYGVIMGIINVDKLGIDLSRTNGPYLP
jgi:hypothetical protein